MKFVILILDGAAGLPVPSMGGKTSLELAVTPNLDRLAGGGILGLCRTVPAGMEASSACACMSIMGYDPAVYYGGRAAIEAASMGIPVGPDEVVFRCNLVTIQDGLMQSYCAGHISTEEAAELIESLNSELGTSDIRFYPGVGYRHILKIKNHPDVLGAITVPAHDIPGKAVKDHLPSGKGSRMLCSLIDESGRILATHPVNRRRRSAGLDPASSIWLAWGSARPPEIPRFKNRYGLSAAVTSGVDLLKGLALMTGMDILDIEGVTDGQDNDCSAQVEGALSSLEKHDLVIIHYEAPDEAGHAGSVEQKISSIEKADREMLSRLVGLKDTRVLAMPDHPTPVTLLTHTGQPVPFVMWGPGLTDGNGARLTEAEARLGSVEIDPGWKIMGEFIGR